jgi:hypothetical protein
MVRDLLLLHFDRLRFVVDGTARGRREAPPRRAAQVRSIRRTRLLLAGLTIPALLSCLFRFDVFLVRIWLLKAFFRRIFPDFVVRNLFLAPRFDFSFGISTFPFRALRFGDFPLLAGSLLDPFGRLSGRLGSLHAL